jgi:hypothetical protein
MIGLARLGFVFWMPRDWTLFLLPMGILAPGKSRVMIRRRFKIQSFYNIHFRE